MIGPEDTHIAVVIPFYQRESGILMRAVKSVFAQRLPPDIRMTVVIVDDASPVEAAAELAGFEAPAPHDLRIVRQDNAGPGGARNTALDLIDPGETPHVAFLDSDDEWEPDHLATALDALADGHDFYFCDHVRDEGESCFSESPMMRDWSEGIREHAPQPVAGKPGFSSLPARAAFDAFLEEYLSQTSTVVYRFDRHPHTRFDTSLRNAGEDHMFWLTLLDSSESAVFSSQTNVRCGRGVNIFFSAVDWKNPMAAARAGYLMTYRLKLRAFRLSPPQAEMVDAMIRQDKKVYAYLLFRNALRGRLPDQNAFVQVARTSLTDALSLPLMLLPMLLQHRRLNS